jgi:YegS/Rv2252/BmrU family lipid kinase
LARNVAYYTNRPGGCNVNRAVVTANRTIRRVHLIVNPHSGYGGGALLLADLRAAAAQAGIELVEYTTRRAHDATEHARRIAPDAQAVIVWGGDGTVNEVVNALAGTAVPILPCPMGTENLLAKELRVPSDPRRIIRTLLTGYTIDCDVGVINGRSFMLIIGIGFDGEVVRRVASGRAGHISHLSYFWPIWRTFWEHDFPHLRVEADGAEVFRGPGLAFVGNISRYAVGLRICRDALFDDGLLDMVIFRCSQQTRLLLHAAWTLLRVHPLKGTVLYHTFRRARIETDRPVPTQVDGDVGPPTPLEVAVAPDKVKVLVPPRRTNWGLWPWRGDVA